VKLTEKQKRFCDYYVETGNATEAAIKAGYSEKTARFIASENLTKPYIKNYIDARLKELQEKRIAKAEEVMTFLSASMRGELQEEVVVVEGLGEGASEAKIIKKQISAKDRIKAAELLGKRYALFTDKLNVDATVGVQIIDDIDEDEDVEDDTVV